MLNRIYIVVGMLAIIVLAGAFIAPNFIRWSDYRGRMEELASAVLGTPVAVRGDIDFSLLPQPRLRFSNVLVGSPEEPAATVDNVEAEFALMDFLRDNYTMTRLVLNRPVIDFTVDESGFLGSGVTLANGSGGVGLGQTTVVEATIRLMDRRSRETYVADAVSGELRLSGFSGPFSFTGTGTYQQEPYSLRFNSGVIDANGKSRVSMFLQPQSAAYTMALEGLLEPGMAPKFDGDMVYRQKPPAADVATDIRGDLVLESKVTGSTDRIVLTGYTLRPDENRASTRLTGAASIQLGAARSFDAVLSGGVFSLPPRDAKEDATTLPYEMVRLLAELPAPIVPPIAGRVDIDLAEIGLRGVALRNLSIDATTDGTSWQVEQFSGTLPGETELRASGQLSSDGARPSFRGDMMLTSTRLDGLAALWRKPSQDNVLFNQPASLGGRIILGGDALGLVGGSLLLGEHKHLVEVRLGFGEEKRLDVVGHFDTLDARDSAVVAALVPDISVEPSFGISFPEGSFSLSGQSARVLGLDGSELLAEGSWSSGAIQFSRLSAQDWGGLGFEASATARGTLADPKVFGSGTLQIARAEAPGLLALHDLLGTPQSWRDFLALSAPADLRVALTEPFDGSQTVTLEGMLGVSALNLRAALAEGGLGAGPLRVTAALESTDIDGLTAQLGLGDAELFVGEGSMLVSLGLAGTPGDSLDANLTASLGDETISYAGTVLPLGNGDIQGSGRIDLSVTNTGGLAHIMGAQGLTLPGVTGSADVSFTGARQAQVTGMSGKSADTGLTGTLALTRSGGVASVSGDIALDLVSVEGLAAALFGPAALVPGSDVWPEGPVFLGDAPRGMRGTIAVTAPAVAVGSVERFGKASFELSWDETRTRLNRFEAVADLGTIGLDMTVCCAGPLLDKTVSGRLSVAATPVELVAPPALAEMLDGVIDGGVQFEGTGASLAELMGRMTGEGNVTLSGISVAQLSPEVYPAVASLEGVLEMDSDTMGTLMGMALAGGAFEAPTATGAFTIAGGVARLTNFIIEGAGAQLAGTVNLALDSLGLDGSFTMTPRGLVDIGGLVSVDTSRVITRLGGTLEAPEVTLDLDEMIAAVLVRANELEVDRLETLRAEDAERQRAAAEERNRLIEEQRRKAAEAAARLEQEEAAKRAAEEEAQRQLQLQLQQAPQPSLPAPSTNQRLDLGFQYGVNQPGGTTFNQPTGPIFNQPIQ